jgi:hypothetical protein
MRNDDEMKNDRRRRVPLANDGSGGEAARILLSRGWEWDGYDWCEPLECQACDKPTFKVDESTGFCEHCLKLYQDENY